jgi:shikimate kinase
VRTDKVVTSSLHGRRQETLARALGGRLGWRAEDVDERIEAREHRTIAEVFSREGEPYFRSVERQVLLDRLRLATRSSPRRRDVFADL